MNRWLQKIFREFFRNIGDYVAISIAIVLAVLNVLGLAAAQFLTSITLAVLGVVAFSVLRNRHIDETIKTMLAQVVSSLPPRAKVYDQQENAYKFLEEYIQRHYVREAILLQYSCTSAKRVLRAALSRGATAIVYIQHEETAMTVGSHEQGDRVTHWCKGLHGDLADLFSPHRIKVYKYHRPGSVSGIKIDVGTEQVLCMGWYTYEYVDGSNRNLFYPADTVLVLPFLSRSPSSSLNFYYAKRNRLSSSHPQLSQRGVPTSAQSCVHSRQHRNRL